MLNDPAATGEKMAGQFWRVMSMQHWPEEARRAAASSQARAGRDHVRPFADGQTLVETLGLDGAEPHRAAWRGLVQRAMEPNPFLDPDFALSASLHSPAGQRPEFLFVWQGVGFEPRARLIGLWTLDQRRANLLGVIGRSWSYRHAALGTPLIDRFAGPRSVDAVLTWAARGGLGRAALSIAKLVRGGPVFELISERCALLGMGVATMNEHERAVLLPASASADVLARARSAKHRREIDRLARRLAERGEVSFKSTSEPAELRVATEWFLALEQRGWKGRRGTALLSDVGDAAFARAMTRMLARAGRCRIDWIALDGKPIAMAIMLKSGDRGYFWKTAYDEAFAQYSPGVQLARALIDRQLESPSTELTDSCAIADHPMIDRIWPDRQQMADLLIGVDPGGRAAFPLIAGRARLQRNVRAALKAVANTALRRRAS